MIFETSAKVNKNLVKWFLSLFKPNHIIPLKVHLQLSQITLFQFSKIQWPLYVKTRCNPYVSFWCESHNSHTYPPPDILSFRIVFLSALQEKKKSEETLLPWYINASLTMDVAVACWQYEYRTSKSSFQMPHTIK